MGGVPLYGLDEWAPLSARAGGNCQGERTGKDDPERCVERSTTDPGRCEVFTCPRTHELHPCHLSRCISDQEWTSGHRHGPSEKFLQGFLAHKKRPPPPHVHPEDLGAGLPQGPGAVRVVMGEVPLYGSHTCTWGTSLEKKHPP